MPSTPVPYSGYVAFPKALTLLNSRLSTCPEEIAAWIWLGPKHGGLTAYKDVFAGIPQQFHYDYIHGKNYLAPLMGCWFLEEHISKFTPKERFMSGKVLIERWCSRTGPAVVSFIEAKIDEGRLTDLHPTMGNTQASFPGDEFFPPIEAGLYSNLEILDIEKIDFGVLNYPISQYGAEWRQENARNAANALHNKPGGSREKQQKVREIWATGKYTSRDICAEQECGALGMSYKAARNALINTPEP